jgi:hypothetical protein
LENILYHLVLKKYLEHDGGGSTSLVSTTEGVQLVGQKFLAGQGLDDDVQTGQNGVSLGQEVSVAHKFVLGNSGELAEHLLVFGVGSDEAEFTRTHSILIPICNR